MSEEKKYFKRLSISTAGNITSVSQSAKNLSEALNQELEHYSRQKTELAQINLEEEE